MKQKKQIQPKLTGGQRAKRGKFVVPTASELMEDRKQFIDHKTREIIMAADNMTQMICNLDILEAIILMRRGQLNMDEKFENPQCETVKITELFNGAVKSVEMLKAELRLNLYTYRANVRELERMKEMFVLKYEFTPEQVESVMKGTFDIVKWAKEYQDSQLNSLKECKP